MFTSDPGLPPLAAFGVSAPLRRRLAGIVIGALFLSTLLTIADGHSVAWNPGHGHIYRAGVAVTHAHPWDASARSAHLSCVAPAASGDVVFTPSAEALAGASIAAPLLVGEPAAPCVPGLIPRPASAPAPMIATAAFATVPTPPPRG